MFSLNNWIENVHNVQRTVQWEYLPKVNCNKIGRFSLFAMLSIELKTFFDYFVDFFSSFVILFYRILSSVNTIPFSHHWEKIYRPWIFILFIIFRLFFSSQLYCNLVGFFSVSFPFQIVVIWINYFYNDNLDYS